jgi:hypothetical protein
VSSWCCAYEGMGVEEEDTVPLTLTCTLPTPTPLCLSITVPTLPLEFTRQDSFLH